MYPAPTSSLRKFKRLLKNVLRTNEFYKRKFKAAGIVSGDQINTWNDFFSLPLTTRTELIKDQQKAPPFGTNITRPLSEYTYVNRTSGTSSGTPFYQPLTHQEFNQYANVLAQGYRQLGVKKKDTICFLTSSYAYPLFYEASQRLGIRMVPIDDYKTISLFNIIKSMRINILQGFPTALFELIELADDMKIDLKKLNIKRIITIGEVGGGHPPTKAFFEKAWNAKVVDHIGQLESATLAVECLKEGNTYHLLKNLFIAEVFDPFSNRHTTKGELVLTSLWKQDYPIIRYRTGDIVKIDYSRCSCGRTTPRLIGGILARATGQLKIRSLFVFPEDLERTIRKHNDVKEFQIICQKQKGVDKVDVFVELSLTTNWKGLGVLLKELEETLGFRPNLYPVPPKTLPRFGSRKGSRFHDYRYTKDRVSFPIGYYKKIMSKVMGYIIIWNSRKYSVQSYLSLIRSMGRK